MVSHTLLGRVQRRRLELQRRVAAFGPGPLVPSIARDPDRVDVSDLELAGQIQQRFAPRCFQRIGHYEIGSAVLPAGPVCGDVFETSVLGRRWAALWLLDATGHGVAAGMLSAYLQSHLRRIAWDRRRHRPRRPDAALALLNRLLLAHQPSEPMFVATALCVLDLETHAVSLARGGTPIPALVRTDGRVEPVTSAGRLVGIEPGDGFETAGVELRPGESLVLWTDGLERLLDGEYAPGDGAACEALDFGAVRDGRVVDALERLRLRWWQRRKSGACYDDVCVAIVRRWR